MDLHDVHIPIDPCATVAVVANSADHATDGSAVATRTDAVGAAGGIPSVVIVHKTISVVVHAVSRRFSTVDPMV